MSTVLRRFNGDVAIGILLAIAGAYWMYASLALGFWDGFAPGSGFLPFWYGLLLVGFSIVILLRDFASKPDLLQIERDNPRKPLFLIVLVALSIAVLQVAGFAPTIFLMVFVMFAVVERLPLPASLLSAAGVAATLYFLFEYWLAVPLPRGPLGI